MTGKESRLRRRLAEAEERWRRLDVLHGKLRLARDLETRVEEQLRLDARIQDASADRAAAEAEIEGLERDLSAFAAPPRPAPPTRPLDLVFSHVPGDSALLDALLVHLDPTIRGGVAVWPDRAALQAQPGGSVLESHLGAARVIVLLASAEYLASKEIQDVHLPLAMRRSAAGEALVVPVLLRACDWETSPFGKLVVLPRDGTPVVLAPDRDTVFVDIARSLRAAIGHSPASPDAPRGAQ